MFNKLDLTKNKKLADKVAPAMKGERMYLSKSMLGLCKNGCGRQKRANSAYCQNCSQMNEAGI